MASNKLKGLITDQDKRQFLRDIYEESVVDSTKKRITAFSNEEFFGGECPHCHTINVFANHGKRRYGNKEFVFARCEGAPPDIIGCGKDVLIKVRVKQDGDILSGYKFTPYYDFYTVEEIESKFGAPVHIDLDEDVKKEHETMAKIRENEAKAYREKKKLEKKDIDSQIPLKRFVVK